MQGCLVVEHEPRAFGKRERHAGVHHERVVDDVGLVGQKHHVLVDNESAPLNVGIDGAAAKHDGLLCAVLQEEMQLVLEVERLGGSYLGRRHLDADDEAVVLQHLEVVPDAIGEVASVHIDAEQALGASFELNRGDAHAVAVIVEGIERLCAAGNRADERVEGNRVLRELEAKAGIVREAFIVGASRGKQGEQRKEKL